MEYNQKAALQKTIKILSVITVISFTLNYILSIVVQYFGLSKQADLLLISSGVITVLAVFFPFAVGGKILNKEKHRQKTNKSPVYKLLMTIFGFSSCMTINFLVGLLSAIFPIIGGTNFTWSYDTDTLTFILMIVVLAVLPALCEETAFRGIVMESLEKYGNRFAAVISALLFAILHQSLSAMIFAFFSGLIFGFIKKSTGSLVPSVAAHFLNNAVGIVMTVLSDTIPLENYIKLYYAVIGISILAMAVSFIICKRKYNSFGFVQSEIAENEKENFAVALKNIFLYGVVGMFAVFVLFVSVF